MGATIGTRLYTWWKGEEVGRDRFGNVYYRERDKKAGASSRRWVIYDGEPEASKVPPEWHAWLHRTIDEIPTAHNESVREWEKEHIPNLTGTDRAYFPPGSLHQQGGKRAKATGDYEAWTPE